MPIDNRLGGTLTLYDATTANTPIAVQGFVGIDIGDVQQNLEAIPLPNGATGQLRGTLQPITVSFRTRNVSHRINALKDRIGVDMIYTSNLRHDSDYGTPGLGTARFREVVNVRGIIRSAPMGDVDVGTTPVKTVTIEALQYLYCIIEGSMNITTQAFTEGVVAAVQEFANFERVVDSSGNVTSEGGIYITGGYVNATDAVTPMKADSYADFTPTTGDFEGTTGDTAPTSVSSTKFHLSGANISARPL